MNFRLLSLNINQCEGVKEMNAIICQRKDAENEANFSPEKTWDNQSTRCCVVWITRYENILVLSLMSTLTRQST